MSGYAPLFLLNNRAMMGFGTDELTIFQIAKELVDNAVDSIRQLELSEEICETKSIHLLIDTSCVDENRGLVRIECSDSGTGIYFPLRDAMTAFGTSKIDDVRERNLGEMDNELELHDFSSQSSYRKDEKVDRNPSTPKIGKFGIGLSACLLYSSIDNESSFPLTVCTKTKISEKIKIAKFGISKSNKPILLEYTEEYAVGAHDHGTRIALFARIPGIWIYARECIDMDGRHIENEDRKFQYDETKFDNAMNKIEDYICRIKILLGDFRISLRVIDPFFRGARLPVERINELSTEPDTTVHQIARWASRHLNYPPFVVLGDPHHFAVGPDISFTCRSALICEAAGSSSNSDLGTTTSRSVPMKLLRYFNSSPVVLDAGKSQSNAVCDVVTAALGGTKWRDFGCDLDLNSSPWRLFQLQEREQEQNSLHLHILNQNLELASANRGVLGESVVIREVLILLDTLGDLPYTNMQKCGLTFSGRPEQNRAITKVVTGSIEKLRRKIVDISQSPPTPFLASRREYRDHMLKYTAIPSIAEVITRILHSGALESAKLHHIQSQLGMGVRELGSPSVAMTKFRLEALLDQSFQSNSKDDSKANEGKIVEFEDYSFTADDENNYEE